MFKSINNNARIVITLTAFLLCVCVVALISFRLRVDPIENATVVKRFKQVLAEDISVQRHGIYGVDLVKCGACRIEKRKFGMTSFGGFNVLVVDDLDVILPPKEVRVDDLKPESAQDVRTAAKEILDRMGLSRQMLRIGDGDLKFSGLRINNLSLSTLTAQTNVCPRLVAACGEAKKDGLHLKGCRVINDGQTNYVGRALLKVSPELKLVWTSGEILF